MTAVSMAGILATMMASAFYAYLLLVHKHEGAKPKGKAHDLEVTLGDASTQKVATTGCTVLM